MGRKKKKTYRKRMRSKRSFSSVDKHWISSNNNEYITFKGGIYFLMRERVVGENNMITLLGEEGFQKLEGFIPIKYKKLALYKINGRMGKSNLGSFTLGPEDSDIRVQMKILFREERL